MYKLFLCLRYLRSRVLAYFAALGVALCVFMMLIVMSLFNGFLHRIESAAKGLFGDIIVESETLSGMGHYDDFIREVKAKVPEAQAASPWIFTYGILRLPGTDWRQTVQVAGVRLPERADVTGFAKGLFVQPNWPQPTFDPPADKVIDRLRQDVWDLEKLQDGESRLPAFKERARAATDYMIPMAIRHHQLGIDNFAEAKDTDARISQVEKEIKQADDAGEAPDKVNRLKAELDELSARRVMPPSDRMILGVGIPALSKRTREGKTIRYIVPGEQMVMTLIPLGKSTFSSVTPMNQRFTIIDDCRTDVSSIDNNTVYVPFETLQRLNDMNADEANPARCSAIHIKVRGGGLGDERYLGEVRDRIKAVWGEFVRAHPEAARGGVNILTWRERQEVIISNIASQRIIVMIIFAIMSSVAVVLVFVLFYTVVVQKTKDIGVLKAVGGSSMGVAQIFLGYGAAVGFVGSILGVAAGTLFVHNINPIHDWVGRTFGVYFWSREYFLFDKIPNEVELLPTAMIVVAAIGAGLLGALLPAMKAAWMQPVEALRYE